MRIYNFINLIALILKRDCAYLASWIFGLVVLAVFFVPMLPEMVGDDASRTALEETMQNPAMIAMCGIVPGADDASVDATANESNGAAAVDVSDGISSAMSLETTNGMSANVSTNTSTNTSSSMTSYTLGAMFTQFMLVWTAMGFIIFNILFIVRHTRKNEEEGRLELIEALPVGRNANLFAVLLTVLLADVLTGVLVAAIIPLFGVQSIDFAGALVFAASLAACGFAFAGIAALFSQLAGTSRGAMGLALLVFGVAYLLRAWGDTGGSDVLFASMLSPIGLIERTAAFVDNITWPVAVVAMEGIFCAVVAFVLSSVRDLGAGMLPSRGGRAHASFALCGEWTLALRQLRGMLVAWALAVFSFSAAYGSVFGDMQAFIENNEMYRAMMQVGASQSDFLNPVVSTLTMIMTLIATVPVVFVILRLKSEEQNLRLEQVMGASVSRGYLFVGYLLIAIFAALIMQLLIALGLWCTAQASMGSMLSLETCVNAALSYLPASLLFAGMTALFVGLLPRLTNVVWVYLVFSFFVAFFGNMLTVPSWVENLSPFSLLPRYPADAIDPALAVALLGISLVAIVVGIVAYRRRDLGL